MRVLVVDPGFSGHGGHHRAVSGMLVEAALARGMRAQALANIHLDGSSPVPFPVARCLKGYPYVRASDSELSSAKIFVDENRILEESLRLSVPPGKVRPHDLFVVHTAVPEHLLAYHAWFSWIGRPDTSLRLILRFPPGFFRPQHAAYEEILARYALHAWRDVPANVRFFADLDPLARYFSDLSGIPFGTTPIAIDFAGVEARLRVPSDGLTWIFAGEARKAKGAGLVPAAFRAHLERHPNDRLRIQTMKLEPDDVAALEALGDRVDLVRETLHGADYLNYLASGDAVLVPYRPSTYWLRTSHILLESLGLARPVVTCGPSWMADQLAALPVPAGVVMADWTVEALIAAMAALASDADTLLANAYQVSSLVRSRNNAGALLDCMLEGHVRG